MDDLTIRKSNKIVQKTLNRFTYKQNQLMAILLGKYVNLNTNECIDTSVSIDELRRLLGITDGSENYALIKSAIKRFGENGSVGCLEQDEKGEYEYVWRPYFKEIRVKQDECIFAWNDLMKPYLIELKNNYTQYLANDYLKLKSVHSQNLYEQLKSLENYESNYHKKPFITVDEIRQIMQTDGRKAYDRWGAFKQLVLDKAINEINEVTDLNIEYETIKRGRNVKGLEFDIKRKKWNYTKQQKDTLPTWYNDTESEKPSDDLLKEVVEKQNKIKEV